MSASKAGPILWPYYNDFYQEDMLFTDEVNREYYEAIEMLREMKLQAELDSFELWQDDPAFGDDDETE